MTGALSAAERDFVHDLLLVRQGLASGDLAAAWTLDCLDCGGERDTPAFVIDEAGTGNHRPPCPACGSDAVVYDEIVAKPVDETVTRAVSDALSTTAETDNDNL